MTIHGSITPQFLYGGESPDDILSFMIEDDNMDIDGVIKRMKKERKEKTVKSYHQYSITHSKDGKFRTWIKDESVPGKRRQIVRTKHEDLIDYLLNHYSQLGKIEELESITMRSLFDEWIEYKTLHVERTTIERVRRDWNRYYSASSIVDRPIKELSKLDIDTWVHSVIRTFEMNKHQYANFSCIIRQELDYAVDKGVIEHNPFRDVKIDKRKVLKPEHKKPDETQVFSEEELEKVYELAWDDYYKKTYRIHQLVPLVVMFMFQTGLRVGEVCGIRYDDINSERLTVRRMVRQDGEVVEHTKGTYGERTILLTSMAIGLIEAAKERQVDANVSAEGYIFSMRETPVLYSSIEKAFYKYCKKIGVAPKSSHKARKTFISTLIDANINLNTVRQWVGHVDERTTLNNYCFDRSSDEEKRRKLEAALLS